ncbi:flagellar protein FlaG [Caloramator fervidus]|uniref:Flagellar protein FlaG n=1 Tax=Caloramator fervidus TaxID=29344 RepID=A0A1H5WJP9_9CLOT|nr:flagellar protein FlaG [Caloramator fervidus]SEF99511.1 flagellar protein FlaG [Caloramator fervidus]
MEVQKVNFNSNVNYQIKQVEMNNLKMNKQNNENIEPIYSKKEVEKAVEVANKFLKASTHLKFEIHEKTNDVIVKIIRDDTGEVLKEIPPKKILDMVASMMEVFGLFIDEKI